MKQNTQFWTTVKTFPLKMLKSRKCLLDSKSGGGELTTYTKEFTPAISNLKPKDVKKSKPFRMGEGTIDFTMI